MSFAKKANVAAVAARRSVSRFSGSPLSAMASLSSTVNAIGNGTGPEAVNRVLPDLDHVNAQDVMSMRIQTDARPAAHANVPGVLLISLPAFLITIDPAQTGLDS